MRLTLDAAPSPLVVADDGSTVSGTAVPFGEVGHTSAGPVRFVAGSIRVPDDYAAPFCLDHDLSRPVGVLVELVDEADRARFVAALDPVPAAEYARAQMRSGSRSGVSVSVDVIDHEVDEDGTLVVLAGELVELSSVVRPAFRSARVAAQEGDTMSETLAVEAATKTKTPDPVEADPVEPDAPARVPSHMPRTPGGSGPVVSATVHALAREVVEAVRASDRDSRSVRAVIEQADSSGVRAALADLTTANVAVPGSFITQIDNYVRRGMPEVEAFRVVARDAFPVYQLTLDTEPVPAAQSADKAEIASTGGAASFVQLDGTTHAWGKDVALQLIDDGGEPIVEQIVEVAADKVARLIAGAFTTAVEGAAQTGGTSLSLASIGAAIGAVAATGRTPDVILAAPDAYGTLWTLMQTDGPGLSSFYGLDETPRVTLAADLTAGSVIVGASDAVTTYVSRVARLRAVEVGLLGVNIGMYRRAVTRVSSAAGLIKVTSS